MRTTITTIIGSMTLALASCASSQLPEPVASESTILALPFTVDSQSQHGGPLGFHFIYHISSTDGGGVSRQVVFKKRQDGDMLLVDSMPPGDYRVDTFSFVPAGSGDHSYGNNKQTRNIPFTLEAGVITIFPKMLNVRRFNATAGRGMSTTYEQSIKMLSPVQRDQIIKTLQGLPNFDRWKLQSGIAKAESDVEVSGALVPALPAVTARHYPR